MSESESGEYKDKFEHWCQEKADFCQVDGTNPAHPQLVKILQDQIGGWQPIETAPRDGTWLLLLTENGIAIRLVGICGRLGTGRNLDGLHPDREACD